MCIRDRNKLLHYMRKYAIKLESKGDFRKSITYFNECLKYCDKEEAIDIDIIIAKQYERISSHENSYKYFNMAMDNIKKGSYDLKLKVYVALEMIIIKINLLPAKNENITRKLEDVYKRQLVEGAVVASVDSSIGKSLEEIVTELNKMKINKMS